MAKKLNGDTVLVFSTRCEDSILWMTIIGICIKLCVSGSWVKSVNGMDLVKGGGAMSKQLQIW